MTRTIYTFAAAISGISSPQQPPNGRLNTIPERLRSIPAYALAWSGLADAFSASPINGDAPPVVAASRAREAAAHGVRAEPNLAETQTSWALVKFWFDWDWTSAETALRKACAIDPSYPFAHRMMGILLAHMGRHDEAQAAIRRARELDPLVAVEHALSAQVAFVAQDYAAAVQFARQSIVVDPEFWIGLFQLGQAYVELGESELALDAINNAGRFSGGNSKVISLRGYLFAKLGRTNEALQVLNTLETVARDRYVPPYAMAPLHLGLDHRDDALKSLERAYDARDVHLILLPVDPKWSPVRDDARFDALVKSCGFTRSALHPR